VDAPDRIATLKAEIALLEYKEKELDKHKMWVQQSIKNVTDDAGNHEYLLISCRKVDLFASYMLSLCKQQ